MTRPLRLFVYDYDENHGCNRICTHDPTDVPISANPPLFQQQGDANLDGQREMEFLNTVARDARIYKILNSSYVSKILFPYPFCSLTKAISSVIYHYWCKNAANKYYVVLEKEESDEEAEENDSITQSRSYGGSRVCECPAATHGNSLGSLDGRESKRQRTDYLVTP